VKLNSLVLLTLSALVFALPASAARDPDAADDADAEAENTGIRLCMPLPRVSISEATPVVSALSDVLRGQIATFVSGPLVNPRAVASRLPVQARAEAVKLKCRYLLNITFNHHPDSKIGRHSANAALTVGSAAESLGALGGASGALGAAATLGGLFNNGDSDASDSAGTYPTGKNDVVTFKYTMDPVVGGGGGAAKNGTFTAKATRDNEPVVDVLIEKLATEIVDALATEKP
jgi:hypothetical protein